MAARKHHYVPQCYLKLFSVSHKKIPQITVFDRERKKVYKAGIDNVAAQRDFNAIDVEGMDADALSHRAGSPCDFPPIDSTPGSLNRCTAVSQAVAESRRSLHRS